MRLPVLDLSLHTVDRQKYSIHFNPSINNTALLIFIYARRMPSSTGRRSKHLSALQVAEMVHVLIYGMVSFFPRSSQIMKDVQCPANRWQLKVRRNLLDQFTYYADSDESTISPVDPEAP